MLLHESINVFFGKNLSAGEGIESQTSETRLVNYYK
jgi:hypothetical protein